MSENITAKRGRPKKFVKIETEVEQTPVMADEYEPEPEPEPVPSRPSMRPAMRAEDPRARAARRAAEIRGHMGSMDEGTDEFYIPPGYVPDGWDYEWKRKTILGQEDPAYQVALARKGWEAVPADRHPQMMPEGSYNNIERKGMVLMERPRELSEEARDIEKKRARQQVRQKEAQLGTASEGQFERNHDRVRPKIKKDYSPVAIPGDDG